MKSDTRALKPLTAKVAVSEAMASAKVYLVVPTANCSPLPTPPAAPAYCTRTDEAVIPARPAMLADSEPPDSSNTVAVPARRPKLALLRLSDAAEPALSCAETLEPTATSSPPDFAKPTSPVSVTKSLTLADRPLSPKATVLAAIALAKV